MSLGKKLRSLTGKKRFDAPSPPKALKPEVLLTGHLPNPMHGTAPRVVLGQAWWDKERKEAEARTNGHCIACGVHKSLAKGRQWIEGHEVYEVDFLLGEMKYLRTEPLCHYCHAYTHQGRLKALLETGKIHHAKYVAVIQHGDRILKAAGLKRPEKYSGLAADWKDWRLVIGKRRYKGLFKNEQEWVDYHKRKNGEVDDSD